MVDFSYNFIFKLIEMDEQKNCHCGKPTSGYKCSNRDCGAKSDKHDSDHKHDDINTCEICCGGCNEAQSNCGCSPDTPETAM